MALNIWQELDTPRHPLDDYEASTIATLAKLGASAIEQSDIDSDPVGQIRAKLEDAVQAHDPETPATVHFIGSVIGLRAIAQGLSVDQKADTGFNIIQGNAIGHLRDAKDWGSRFTQAHRSLTDNGGTQEFGAVMSDFLESQSPRNPYLYEQVLGFAIGVRLAQTEGVPA